MTARFHALGLAECGTEHVGAHTFYNLHGASQGEENEENIRTYSFERHSASFSKKYLSKR
jgi:hypothetical protein